MLTQSNEKYPRWIFLHDGFKFPIFITCLHMGFCWIACILYRAAYKIQKPREHIPWNFVPLSVCTVGTILFGNVSIKYIYPSFSSMLGSITPLVIMLMQVICGDTRFNCWALAAVPLIVVGVIVCTTGEVTLSWEGIIAQLISTVFRAAKTLFQKSALSGCSAVSPIELLELMSPQCLILGLLILCVTEANQPFEVLMNERPWKVCINLVFNSVNAFSLNLSNFSVSRLVWPITLQLIGSVRTVAGVILSSIVFLNPVGVDQMIGCCVSCVGVLIYQLLGDTYQIKERGLPKSTRDTQNSME